MSTGLSAEDLEKWLPRAPAREAVATIHGFEWQKLLTVETWLNLEPDETLWIEWAEDFSISAEEGPVRTIQAKSGKQPCTLGQRGLLDVISRALERPDPTETVVWFISDVGRERGDPFGEPGIEHWRALATSKRPVDGLRAFLTAPGRLTAHARQRIATADNDAFRRIIARVKWVHGAPSIDQLRARIVDGVVAALSQMGVKAPELLAPSASAMLTGVVGATSVQREAARRRLNRGDLVDCLMNHNVTMHSRAVVTAPGYGPAPFRKVLPSHIPATPLSAGWFVYTERVIPMVGREQELEQLRAFTQVERDFSWWMIAGPAGVGKSRLAQEVIASLPADWRGGFVELARLDDVAAHVGASGGHAFIVIDYASMDPPLIGRFLAYLSTTASSERQTRVLLLDRDLRDEEEWLKRLADPLTARSVAIEASRYRPVLMLNPLHRRERELMAMWLEAAGLDPAKLLPRRKAYVWSQLRRLTGSRPLHLGFAAAAFASGAKHLEAPEDLLDGVLRREVARWRGKVDSEDAYAASVDGLAVATAAWGLPIPWSDTLNEWYVVVETPEAQERYLPQKFHNRMVSYAELIAEPQTREMAQTLIQEAVERVAPKMRPGMRPQLFTDFLWQLRELTGGSWRIEPDAVGEYFLAQYWKDRPDVRQRRYLPCLSDEELTAQLRSAWGFRPLAVILTLSHLREHTWAASAVARTLLSLTEVAVTTRPHATRDVEVLANLLHDAVIRIGKERLPHLWSQSLLAALRRLQKAYPASPKIAYFYFRRLKASPAYEDANFDNVMAELFEILPLVMQYGGGKDVHLHAMDVVNSYLSGRTDSFEDPFTLVANVRRLVGNVERTEEFDALISQFCFLVTVLEHPSLHTGKQARRFHQLHAKLEKLIEPLLNQTGRFSDALAKSIVNTLFNLTVIYRRDSNVRHVAKLSAAIDVVWGNRPPDDIYRRAKLGAEFNLMRASLQRRFAAKARQSLEAVVCLLDGCTNSELRLGLVEMHSYGIAESINARRAGDLSFYMKSLFKREHEFCDRKVLAAAVDIAHDLEIMVGAVEDTHFVIAAGKQIEEVMWERPIGRLLKSEFRDLPFEDGPREAIENSLIAICRYASLVGLSPTSEIKLGRLLAFYRWRFGVAPPARIAAIFPFSVECVGSEVIVMLPEGAFPGIRTFLPFEFPPLHEFEAQVRGQKFRKSPKGARAGKRQVRR
jgi:hypothetical protein